MPQRSANKAINPKTNTFYDNDDVSRDFPRTRPFRNLWLTEMKGGESDKNSSSFVGSRVLLRNNSSVTVNRPASHPFSVLNVIMSTF